MSAAPAIAAKAHAKQEGQALPMAVVCLCILVVWYLAAIPMNAVVSGPKIEAAGGGFSNLLYFSWNEARPVIPAPHQIVAELWKSVFTVAPWMPKSLIWHGWVTLSSTLLGFVLGSLLGIVLAIARRLGLPIRYIGIGEQAEDFGEVDAEAFARALVDGAAGNGDT